MHIRIKLVGCSRYSLDGEVFEKMDGTTRVTYELPEAKALALLERTDDFGRPFFMRVEKPAAAKPVAPVVGPKGARVIRRVAKPEAAAVVKSGGDASALEDEDKPVVAGDADDDSGDGVEV